MDPADIDEGTKITRRQTQAQARVGFDQDVTTIAAVYPLGFGRRQGDAEFVSRHHDYCYSADFQTRSPRVKTIGLIGGMSWQSSLLYYRMLNKGVERRLGGHHSAQILLHSVDFQPIEALQHAGDWDGAGEVLADAARRLQAGGADFFLIGTNTMHRVADQASAAVDIPLLHIADATAQVLQGDGVERIGLLGTAFTMELDFYKQRLIDNFGIDVVIPDMHDRQIVHDIIYQELCVGKADEDSREVYLAVMDRMAQTGIDGIILGCTEIGMLVQPQHTPIRLYDTTEIHAQAAVEMALAEI